MTMTNFRVTIALIAIMTVSLVGQHAIYNESDIQFQTLFIDAELAAQMGDSETQISKLKEVLKQDMTAHPAYYSLAKAYLKLGNYELAEKNIQKAISYKDNNEWYLLTAADISEKGLDPEQAIKYYQKLHSLQSDNPVIYHRMAMNQLNANKGDDAVKTLLALQDLEGVQEESSKRIFEIQSKAGNSKAAKQELEKLIATYPNNPRLMNNLAGYLMEIGDNKEAHKIYKEVLVIDPENVRASVETAKLSDNNTANGAGQLGQIETIIGNKNIPLDDKIRELMPYLSTISPDDNNNTALIDISEKLLADYPNDAKTLSINGDVLFYTRDFKGAEKQYAKAISIDDSKFSLWEQYIMTLWELSKYNKMEDISIDALDYFPNNVHAYLYNAIGLFKTNDQSGAKNLLSEAKLVSGDNAVYKDVISIVDSWINNSDIDLKSINVDLISSAFYTELLGDLYKSQGNKKLADNLYNRAINMGSNPIRINKKIGA